jgi:putative oxidoreductase
MSLANKLLKVRENVLGKLEKLKWLGPLLGRLAVAVVFIGTGWGKLHGLDKVTEFFTDLHLPAPHFQATLVATTEFVGGLFILVGLFTRLAAAPLAFTMVIAILTAKRGDIEGITSLFGFEEFTYMMIFLWLAISGPGALSIDRWLAKRLEKRPALKPLLRPRSAAPEST